MTETLADIVGETTIEARPELVWRALVTPEHIANWLGCLQFSAEVGHVFYMQQDPAKREVGNLDGATHCEVLALETEQEFRFSWYLPGTPKTEVSIKLEAAGEEETRVHLRHSGWDQFPADAVQGIWQALSGGWCGAVLPQLKSLVESGSV